MTKGTAEDRRSVAIDPDVYRQIADLADQADTSKGAVASAILRIGLKYYRARWVAFLQANPELAPNGRDIEYTTNTPVVPRR